MTSDESIRSVKNEIVRRHAAGSVNEWAGHGTPASKRILIVDDNHDQAETLSMLLKIMGHEVRAAFDGPSAMETAATFVPDIALIDIGIPGFNGYELARRIRQQPQFRRTLLVAQTGWGQDEDRRRSQEAGFDHHLVKPVEIRVLEQIVASDPPAPTDSGS